MARRSTPLIAALFAPGLLTSGSIGLSALPAFAAEAERREATIIVSGESEAALSPDMAIVTLSVVKQAETAAEALVANNVALAAVLADLKSAGIAERDIQTSGFSISPRYRQRPAAPGGYETPEIVGYTVTNGLRLKVRDLARLGEIVDRSVKLGINDGGGITFTNDDPEPAIREARKQAVREAVEKARDLTEAAGVRLGRIIEISENFARPMPQQMYRAAASMAKEMDAMPIAIGENNYSVTVNVTFGIDQ